VSAKKTGGGSDPTIIPDYGLFAIKSSILVCDIKKIVSLNRSFEQVTQKAWGRPGSTMTRWHRQLGSSNWCRQKKRDDATPQTPRITYGRNGGAPAF